MTEPRLYIKTAEMIKLLHVYLRHFPRYEKNALAERILNTAYDVFELIVEGQKMYYKNTTLTKLDKTHEILKMQIWLAHELDYFSFKDGRPGKKKTAEHRHSAISSMVSEVGKMIGGWIKKIKEENQWK